MAPDRACVRSRIASLGLLSGCLAGWAASAVAGATSPPRPAATLAERQEPAAAKRLVAPAATFAEQVAQLINQERANCTLAACPLSPLKHLPLLGEVAGEHSRSMAESDFFSHCDFVTGLDPFERLVAAGYSYFSAAENIAGAAATPAAVVAQWMGSATHRANILADGFREQGVGYYRQAGDLANIDYDRNSDCDCIDSSETCSYSALTHYWTELFGLRNPVYPLVIERELHETTVGTVELYVYGPASAIEMRFSNDGASWSAWRTFAHETSWTLAAGDGLRTVYSEVRNATTVYRSCDRIWRTGSGGPEILVDGFDCDGTGAWAPVP